MTAKAPEIHKRQQSQRFQRSQLLPKPLQPQQSQTTKELQTQKSEYQTYHRSIPLPGQPSSLPRWLQLQKPVSQYSLFSQHTGCRSATGWQRQNPACHTVGPSPVKSGKTLHICPRWIAGGV